MKVRIIKSNNLNLYSFVLFILGYLLFWEWLRPLEEVTPLDSIPILLAFSAIVFLVSFLHVTPLLSIPIYAVSLLYVVHTVHFQGSIFEIHWILVFLAHLVQLVQALLTASFYEISDVSRTFLFLLLFCLIGYLMRQWLLQRRNVFPFIFMTVVYATVIDTFTPYDASFAIIRIVIIGFVLIGMLQVAKINEREGFFGRHRVPFTWIGLVLFMIASAATLGLAAPKSDPQWADPVPFLKSAANMDENNSATGSVKKQGYGENDEQLGGPFQLDTTPVFYADVESVHYWRAETKDFYTGKGWESSNGVLEPFTGELLTPLYEENAVLSEKEASIEMTGFQKFSFLFYEGNVKDVVANQNPNLQLFENTLTGKLSTQNEVVNEYSFRYDYPTYSIEELKNSDTRSYPNEIERYYLQLPDSLPARVKELAEEVTSDQETNYDKAKAIEFYFVGNGYTYETKNVAVPGRDDDYVDQFLFESKMGYCDNFSSSMVVMLRSIGIPARWVKGFTGGEFQEMLGEGKRRHLITNENAHSWVEAYFPGTGWVPFEPTRGFANPFEFVTTYDSETDVEEQETEQNEQEDQEQTEEKEESTEEAIADFSFSNKNGKWIITAAIVGLIFALVMLKYYRQLAKRWVVYRLKKKPLDRNYGEWYMKLLWLLKLNGFTRKPEQTLREFALEVDKKLEIDSMTKLTKGYEEAVYSNRKQTYGHDMLKNWQTVINKLSY